MQYSVDVQNKLNEVVFLILFHLFEAARREKFLLLFV